MTAALQLVVFLGLPFFAWWACRHSRLLALLSPVMVVYGGGILFGNLAHVGAEAEALTHSIAGVSVMLAIALLMASADFKRWLRLAPITLLAFCLAVATVVALAGGLAFVFAAFTDNAWQVAGMLTGLYTGGTVNMTAVSAALDVDPVTFGAVLSSDLVIGATYLAFLFVAGGKVFGWFLPPFQGAGEGTTPLAEPPRPTVAGIAASLLLGGAVLAVSAGLGELAPAGMSEPAIILGATTLGILLSFVPRLRRTPGAYETGDYMLLVFSGAVGSLATWDRLEATEPALFAYVLAVVLGSVAIHALLCRMCRVDRDTTIITSVAALYGPPFVGPVASALGNREIVVSGVSAGLLGLAAANYLGLAVAYAVRALLPWLQ